MVTKEKGMEKQQLRGPEPATLRSIPFSFPTMYNVISKCKYNNYNKWAVVYSVKGGGGVRAGGATRG